MADGVEDSVTNAWGGQKIESHYVGSGSGDSDPLIPAVRRLRRWRRLAAGRVPSTRLIAPGQRLLTADRSGSPACG